MTAVHSIYKAIKIISYLRDNWKEELIKVLVVFFCQIVHSSEKASICLKDYIQDLLGLCIRLLIYLKLFCNIYCYISLGNGKIWSSWCLEKVYFVSYRVYNFNYWDISLSCFLTLMGWKVLKTLNKRLINFISTF